jgi:ABC-type antimicrobial peptide transport system permease subunit
MVSMTVSGIRGAGGGTAYTVLASAILNQYGSALFSNVDDTVFIPMQAVQFLAKTPVYTGIYVITATPDDVANVQSAIETYYSSNVRVVSPGQILSSITSITSQLSLFLGSIGAVSLFVAAVGIINTMFVSVMERTREIGVMKALGFRPRQIMSIFLAEAALTGVVGGVFGLVIGVILAYFMGGMFAGFGIGGGRGFAGFGGGPGGGSSAAGALTIHPVFSSGLILFSLVFPVVLATLAGLYPAWRASRMNAVVALKYE